ncbi:MAG: serine protease [Anaerolineae bacterium]
MRTKYPVAAAIVLLFSMMVVGAPAHAQGCQYQLGFAAIYNQIPDIVGPCKTNETYDPQGNSNQMTANGMMQWRKADNFTAFTDGYRSWVNGPCGLEMRLNTQRFPWEANPEGLQVVSSRCGAAPAGQAAPLADPAPPPAAAPPAASDENTDTVVRGDETMTAVKRVVRPPAQLTGDVSKRVDESVVQIVRLTENTIGIATGTSVGPDGRTILTAFHVVGDRNTGKVLDPLLIAVGPYMDWELRADVVATDPEHDVAVLRVQELPGFGGFNHLPLADSNAAQLGDPMYVYSYPVRGEGGIGRDTGTLLAKVSNTKSGTMTEMLTDAQIQLGASGGVVVNNRGEVVGIVRGYRELSQGIERRGLPTVTKLTSFVPIDLIKPMLAQAGVQ